MLTAQMESGVTVLNIDADLKELYAPTIGIIGTVTGLVHVPRTWPNQNSWESSPRQRSPRPCGVMTAKVLWVPDLEPAEASR